jgi:hypothetical protein
MHEPGKHVDPSRAEWDQTRASEPFGGNEMSEADLDRLLSELKAPEDVGPAPGFYARVMDRIESQRSNSIWSVFLEPIFGRRLAVVSGLLMLLLGVALFVPSSEFDDGMMAQGNVSMTAREDGLPRVLSSDQDKDEVLVNLVTYQEH